MAMDHDDKRLPLVVESSLVCGRYGVHEEKNEKFRQTMEDEHVLQPNFIRDPPHGLFIVLDGHGGRAAAKRASEWIPEVRAKPSALLSVPRPPPSSSCKGGESHARKNFPRAPHASKASRARAQAARRACGRVRAWCVPRVGTLLPYSACTSAGSFTLVVVAPARTGVHAPAVSVPLFFLSAEIVSCL